MRTGTLSPADRSLYEADETAWLEQTASLAEQGRWNEIDARYLAEYLNDMARRDKREVFSRLVTLLSHLLKWTCQPDKHTPSWRGTILEQRRELLDLLESGTLHRHAEAVWEKAVRAAIEQAAAETDLPESTFSATELTLEASLRSEF